MSRPSHAVGTRVVGVGTDLAGVARLQAALGRQDGLAARLFTAAELRSIDRADSIRVAQRFAAKEAVMKALGVGIDSVAFTDIEVDPLLDRVTLMGRAGRRAAEIGATVLDLEVGVVQGPDGEVATAEVVASSSLA